MGNESLKCEAPTLIGMLNQNDNLIKECLEISNRIYADLTTDNVLGGENPEPTCVMSDVSLQNRNLEELVELLKRIRAQIM